MDVWMREVVSRQLLLAGHHSPAFFQEVNSLSEQAAYTGISSLHFYPFCWGSMELWGWVWTSLTELFTQSQNLRASVPGSMGRENKLLDLSKLLSTLEKPTSWRESAECHNLSLWWPASCHAEQGTSYFAGLLCKFNSWRSKSFSWKNFNSFFSFWV